MDGSWWATVQELDKTEHTHTQKKYDPTSIPLKRESDVRETLEAYQRNVSISGERRAGYQNYFTSLPPLVLSDMFVAVVLLQWLYMYLFLKKEN